MTRSRRGQYSQLRSMLIKGATVRCHVDLLHLGSIGRLNNNAADCGQLHGPRSGTLQGLWDCLCSRPAEWFLEVLLRFFKWLGCITNAVIELKRAISDNPCQVHGRGRTIVNGTCICCATSVLRVASPRAAASAGTEPFLSLRVSPGVSP